MKRLIDTFLAEDNTGNRYRLERYQVLTKSTFNHGDEVFLHKGTEAFPMGDDLYYIAALDTEVKKIPTNK